MKTKLRIFIISFALGIGLCVLDAAIETLLFNPEHSFFDNLIFLSPPHEIFLRICSIAIFIALGFIVFRIVNKQEKIHIALRQSEDKFRKTFSMSPDAIMITRLEDGLIIDVNEGFIKQTGYSAEEAIGNSTIETNIWLYLQDRINFVEELLLKGTVLDFETKVKIKNGNIKPISIAATLIDLGDEKCVVTLAKDISEKVSLKDELRMQYEIHERQIQERNNELEKINISLRAEVLERTNAEEALRESEEKYRSLVNQLPVGVYRTTYEGTIIEANQALANILGLSNIEEVLKTSATNYYNNRIKRQKLIQRQKEHDGILIDEIQLRRLDGKTIWVRDYGKVIQDENGNVLYIDGILEDITEKKEAEVSLRISEEQYRLLFENLHDIFFRIDFQGNIIDISPSAAKIFDYTTEFLIGKNLSDFIVNKKTTEEFISKLRKKRRINNYIAAFKKSDASIIHLSINAYYNINKAKNIAGIDGIARDITKDLLYEHAITAQYNISKAVNSADNLDELYQAIHNSLKSIIDIQAFFIAIIDDSKLKIPYFVASHEDETLINNYKFENQLLVNYVIKNNAPFLLRKKEIEEIVYKMKGRQHSLAKAWIGVPLKIENTTLGVFGIVSYHDSVQYRTDDLKLLYSISDQVAVGIERKRSAIALNFQLKFLQNLIDTIPNPVYYKDASKRLYLGCNKAYEEFIGIPKDKIIGKSVYETFPPDYALAYDTDDITLLNQKGISILSSKILDYKGEERDAIFYKSCFYDQSDNVAGIVGTLIDITDIKKTERDLNEAREYAEMIYKVTPSSIFTIDNNKKITSWNTRAAKLTGYSASEIIGEECSLCNLKEFPEYCPLLDNDAKKPIIGRETKILTKDGQIRTILKNIDVLKNSDGEIIGGIESFEDITDRQQIEEALFWQAGVNSAIADLSKAIISIGSLEEISHLILEHARRLTDSKFGYVGYINHENGFLNIQALFRETDNAPQSWGKNLEVKTFKGLWGWVLNNIQPILTNSADTDPRAKDTEEFFKVKRFLSAPSTSGGKLYGQITIADSTRDYTDEDLEAIVRMASLYAVALQRFRAEEEIRTTLVKEQELNELKSRFISMISHEYRTPLTTIILSTELLRDYADKLTEETKKQQLFKIQKSIDAMNRLLDDIIRYSKTEIGKVPFKPSFIDIEQICADIVNEINYVTKNKCIIRLAVDVPQKLYSIDEKLIRQILVNLLTNAVTYSEEGGLIEFKVSEPAEELQFEVKDYGMGIPKDDQRKIFEPFHRGKNIGAISGTGLGLSIVKNTVEIHGGKIEFESQEGKGTGFIVTIPVKEGLSENNH